jgi:hypothetical protein
MSPQTKIQVARSKGVTCNLKNHTISWFTDRFRSFFSEILKSIMKDSDPTSLNKRSELMNTCTDTFSNWPYLSGSQVAVRFISLNALPKALQSLPVSGSIDLY